MTLSLVLKILGIWVLASLVVGALWALWYPRFGHDDD